MTLQHTALPRAPFAPSGPFEIDHERARKLLTVALSQGGDAADLFAEYGLGASMVLEEGIVKSASRGVSVGVGIRVQRGFAAGYAYTEDLSWEALLRAARTAAQIARGDAREVAEVTDRAHPERYAVAVPSIVVPGASSTTCRLPSTRRIPATLADNASSAAATGS